MVERGLGFLAQASVRDLGGGFTGTRTGIEILIGYAAHKAGRPHADPLVARGVDSAVQSLGGRSAAGHYANYELAVAVLLLADVDSDRYRPLLERAGDGLIGSQLAGGGWGYPGERQGDTSQTQYAVLALWTLDQAGLPVPVETFEKACRWLLRTQSVDGGFGYHPQDPGPGGGRIQQRDTRYSLVIASIGTVLITGDAMGFYRGSAIDSAELGLPPALRRVKQDAAGPNVNVKIEEIENCVESAQRWQIQNPYKRSAIDWHYYTLYALERAMSFMELVEGNQAQEPDWYDRQVRELMQNQDQSGAWGKKDPSRSDENVCTAFAILFLVRSTQKAIGTINEGFLAGGYGLPEDTENARLVGGSVKGAAIQGALNEMLDLLASEEGDALEPDELPKKLPLSTDPEKREQELNRLMRMAEGGPWQARRVAVSTLGQSGELRVVPTLIYALSDPDKTVMRTARDGLRFISRRFDGFGLPDDPDLGQLRDAIRQWRDWYLKVDPSYVFIDASPY